MEKRTQNKKVQSISNSNKKNTSKNINNNTHTSSKKKVNPKLKRIINKISIGTIFILAIISFYLIFRILVLNMIPMKYFMIILLVIFLILGIMSFLLINRKIKWKIKVGGIFFSLIMVFGMLFASKYIENTISFLNKITGNHTETSVYYLVALKDSKINELSDIKNQIGYVSTLGNINEAVDELNEDNDFKYKDYKQILDLKDDLLDKKIDVVLMADFHKQLIEENDEKFSEKIKVIHTINITKKAEKESKDVDITKDAFNVYISGIDTYGEIGLVSRSDVNIIASINPKTKQILLTTIPRDYYVTLHGIGEKDKLTHAGLLGIDTSVGTIEDLLDIDINYYVRVNFSTLEDIVDALDGVDVYSEVAFTGYNGKKFIKGYNHLNGENALVFSRVRNAFIDGDRQRGKNQQAVIKAIVNKAISPSIISNYSDLLKSLQGTFQTNMSSSDIQKFAKFQIDKMPSWDMLSISLNGSDAYKTTYLYGNTNLYAMVPSQDSIDYAKTKIKELISGKQIEVKQEHASGVVQYKPSVENKPNEEEKPNDNQEQIDNDTNITQNPSEEDNKKPSDNSNENTIPNENNTQVIEPEKPEDEKPSDNQEVNNGSSDLEIPEPKPDDTNEPNNDVQDNLNKPELPAEDTPNNNTSNEE